MTRETMDHIERPSLPWRTETRTECGRERADVESVLTRDEAMRKIKDQGQQRAALSTCMTCMTTASRYVEWASSPADVMAREVRGYSPHGEPPPGIELLNRELRAVAALVEAHRDEFDGCIEGLVAAVPIDTLRRLRSQRVAKATNQPRATL
jgi:hypothetical protein